MPVDDSLHEGIYTVDAIAERDRKFLLVTEKMKDEIVFNQPAGHLNPGESLVEAVIRETLEETQYEFTPTGSGYIPPGPRPGLGLYLPPLCISRQHRHEL